MVVGPRLVLVVHPARAEAVKVAQSLVEEAGLRGMTVVAGSEEAAAIPGVEVEPAAAGNVVVSVGGDGTVLQAAQVAMAHDLALFGLNVGRVGFLAEVEPEHLEAALDRLVTGDYAVSPRMTLACRLEGGAELLALNDVVIGKAVNQRIASVAVEVDGRPFRTYRADAVVAATATGSTAYTFSTGGPLVFAELETLVLTAVAPHGLFNRALLFPPSTRLRFTAASERPVVVNADAIEVGQLEPEQWCEVERGATPVRFVAFGWSRFPHNLQQKLGLDDA